MKCHFQDYLLFLNRLSILCSIFHCVITKGNEKKVFLTLVQLFPGLTNHSKCVGTLLEKLLKCRVFFPPKKNALFPCEK